MKGTRVSSRYAKALFGAARTDGDISRVLEDLNLLERIINQTSDFFNLINNPTISHQKKADLFVKILQTRIHNITMQFLFLILKKGREPLLLQIIKKYKELYLDSQNIILAELITASPVSTEIKELIKQKISRNKTVQLVEKIDQKILGGFIINSGDLQYDASVRKKINNVKQAFKL